MHLNIVIMKLPVMQVQVFLLQIQLAKLALEGTRQRSWKLFQDQERNKQVVSRASLMLRGDRRDPVGDMTGRQRGSSGGGSIGRTSAAAATVAADHSTSASAAPAAAVTASPCEGVLDILYGDANPQSAAAAAAGGVSVRSANALASLLPLLGPSAERAVQQEMVNFVNNLHQCILDRLLLNAWVELERVRV